METGTRVTVVPIHLVNGHFLDGDEGSACSRLVGSDPIGRDRSRNIGRSRLGKGDGCSELSSHGRERNWPAEISEPPTYIIEGEVGSDDVGTLQWELRPVRQTVVPDYIGVQVDAYAKGIQPPKWQPKQHLTVVIPAVP